MSLSRSSCRNLSFSLLLSALSTIATPALAAAGTPLTPEIDVAALAAPPSGAPPSQSAVAWDGAGNFAVAYLDGPNHLQLYVRRFHRDGTANGAPFLVFDQAYGRTTALAMNDAGDFVVVALASVNGYGGIHARRYDADGLPQGEPILVGSVPEAPVLVQLLSFTPIYFLNPAVAMNRETGDFLVAWQEHTEFQYTGKGGISPPPLYSKDAIQSRPFDANGRPKARVQTVTVESSRIPCTTSDRSLLSAPVVAASPLGGYGIAWASVVLNQCGADGGKALDSPFKLRIYDAEGRPEPLTRRLEIDDVLRGSFDPGASGTAFAFDADGSVLLAWSSKVERYELPELLHVRRYSPKAAPLGQSVLITQRMQTRYSRAKFKDAAGAGLSLAPSSRGAVMTWADDGDSLIHGQYLNRGEGQPDQASVTPAGASFTVGGYDAAGIDPASGNGLGWLSNLSSVADANDRLVAVWGQIKARVFEAPQ